MFAEILESLQQATLPVAMASDGAVWVHFPASNTYIFPGYWLSFSSQFWFGTLGSPWSHFLYITVRVHSVFGCMALWLYDGWFMSHYENIVNNSSLATDSE